MNPKILVDVLMLEGEGLIGYNELGQQVGLQSNPEPRAVVRLVTSRYNNEPEQEALGRLDEQEFVRFGRTMQRGIVSQLPYAVYKRRT